MSKKRQAVFYFRLAMAALAFLLPLTSLVLLGSFWLWQNGYVLYWAVAACTLTLITYALERWIFRVDLPETAPATETKPEELAGQGWSARETAAWAEVVALSKHVRPLEIASSNDIYDLGVRAIETVARSMHPGEEHALWKFTLPEAFSLIERVSTQLSAFVSDSIPLGDRMTVGQFLRLYRWRSAFDVAGKAYDLWRIVRLMNPAAAATQEIREQLTRRAYDWGREELGKRLAQAYVREVGRAAIDLYSGRMRLSPSGALSPGAEHAMPLDRKSTSGKIEEPIRVLVAGQTGSGTASLISALAHDAQPAPGTKAATLGAAAPMTSFIGGRDVIFADFPGVTEIAGDLHAFFDAVDESDLIVWVTSALKSNREIDKRLLTHIRNQAAKRSHRKPQPILCVVSHHDAVQPDGTWASPHDPANASIAKVDSTRPEISEAGRALHFAAEDVVPVFLGSGRPDNVEDVRQRLIELIPSADRARLTRLVDTRDTKKISWRRLWSQVSNASRAVIRAKD